MLKDKRMALICEMVREGVTVCDVGTDHAYVPVELILSGKAPKCIITDISAPSLEKGVKNAKMAGCGDKIASYCTSGTIGVPIEAKTDIVIAGMGGELIAEILNQDGRLKEKELRFVLQPMSKAEVLRSYLAENGFLITDEARVEEGGRVYTVILCQYTGENYTLTDKELWLGRIERAEQPIDAVYREKVIKSLKIKLSGIESAENRDENAIVRLKELICTLNE